MRVLKRVLLVVFVLALAWLALVLSEWLPRPTEQQLAALEALRPEPANVAGSRNAFAALYLFQYDIPAEELEKVAAADVEAYETYARKAPDSAQLAAIVSTAEGKYPKLPTVSATDPTLCAPWVTDCLKLVRKSVETTRQRVADLALHLKHAEALAVYDHYHYRLPPRWDFPIGVGATGIFPSILTTAALDFVDGKVDAAFERLCHNTATWRRLRAHTDYLIIDMLAVAEMSGAARLYAEMLAEMPADFIAPCAEIFSPLVDAELDQCGALRFEFLAMKHAVLVLSTFKELEGGSEGSPLTRTVNRLINRDHALAVVGGSIGRYCLPEHRARVAARSPLALPETPVCAVSAWAFDPVGCLLLSETMSNFDTYYHRVLDLDARLKLLNSAIWLRTQPGGGDRAAQFASRPESLKSAAHTMSYEAATGVLKMSNIEKGRGEIWEIPFAVPAIPAPNGTDTPPAQP